MRIEFAGALYARKRPRQRAEADLPGQSGAGTGATAEIAVNRTPIPRAESTIGATQEITEFRSGSDPTIQLIPSSKLYDVCIIARSPVSVPDAEFPLAESPSRFTARVEDGRQFSRCLVAGLWAGGRGAKRRFTYCLRCEDVTAPTQ